VHDERGQLARRDPLLPPVGERELIAIGQMARRAEASEQPHHRQVERAVTAVGSGVDEPTDTMPIDQPVAGPQVAV
jgi:hypothetical protein